MMYLKELFYLAGVLWICKEERTEGSKITIFERRKEGKGKKKRVLNAHAKQLFFLQQLVQIRQ